MSKRIEPFKKYYVLLNDGQEVIDYKIPDGRRTTWKNVYDGDVVKVLGPVPSFREVQILKENLRKTISENDKLMARLLRGLQR